MRISQHVSSTISGTVRSHGLLWMVVASGALHLGVLLLPLPKPPAPTPIEELSAASSPGDVMEVTRLPRPVPSPSATEPPPAESAAATPDPEIATAPPAAEAAPEPPAAPERPDETPVDAPPVDDDPSDDLPEASDTAPLETSVEVPDPPSEARSLEDRLQDPDTYQYREEEVLSDGQVGPKLLEWTTPGQILPTKVDVPLEIPYELGDHCLEPAPARGILVVILDPDGTPVQGPAVISSTGYSVLDEQAITLIENREYSFPERDQTTAYSLAIAIAYPERCL